MYFADEKELEGYIKRVEDKLLRSKNFQEQLILQERLMELRVKLQKMQRGNISREDRGSY